MMNLALEIGLHWRAFTVIYSYVSAIFIVLYFHFIKAMNVETFIVLWFVMGFMLLLIIKMGELFFP